MKVVQTYEDSGRSGLTLGGRPALQKLLDDVHRSDRPFEAIVVYDVSRWGRFQDVDESAYYEFVCRRAGVKVLYCAEPFADVPGPMAVVMKSMKRAMAAEFSRELGVKVWVGQSRLTRRGFYMGGCVSFGLRRVLISESGEIKGSLKPGDVKSLQTDRVVLEPGNALDVALVRHIFGLFVRKRMGEGAVARVLNWCCYPGRSGLLPWRADSVRDVLRNEAYVGNLVYNRRTCSLQTPCVMNAPEKWVRAEHCFSGIVSQATFDAAQQMLYEQGRHYWARIELLKLVQRVYAEHGTVTATLIANEGVLSTCFIHHFGSLAAACEAIDIKPGIELARQRERSRARRALKIKLLEKLAAMYRKRGVRFYCRPRLTRRACVELGPTISVRTAAPLHKEGHAPYWLITPDHRVYPDFALVARVDEVREAIIDYFLLPLSETRNAFIGERGNAARKWAERYRYRTLGAVFKELEYSRKHRVILGVPLLATDLERRSRRVLGVERLTH